MADIIKIKLGANVYNVKDASAARKNVYYGTCTTAANTYKKVATVETFPLDGNGKPLVGTVVAIKYSNSNSYKTEGYTYQLNVNSTGDYPMYYNNAELATSTSANTLVAGYKNRHIYYMFNGSQWVWVSAGSDTNTTYSGMTQAEVDAGTGTTARLITPQRLRDNFYTEDEVDTLLGTKVDSSSLATVATSGSYNDLSNKPTIPTTASDVGADVFIVNVENDDGEWVADKTNAEIYAAWVAGRCVICVVDDEYIEQLVYIDANRAVFKSYSHESEEHNIDIRTQNNTQTTSFTTSSFQPFLNSGTNIKTINNNSILDSGNLTPSDLGVPSIANNLTTTTAGSVLDATQGKALNDAISGKADKSEMSVSTSSDTTTITLKSGTSATVINQHNIVIGKLLNGNFYSGVYAPQLSNWNFSNTAETGNSKKLYVDVVNKLLYKYEGSYVSITDDFVTTDLYNIDILDLWENKADVIQVVTVSTTGAVTLALEPNTFYNFTGNPTSLTLTLTSGTGLCIYAGKFTAGTNFSNLSLPASVKEAEDMPTVEAGGTYEFSIMNNLLLLAKEGS